MIESSIDSSTLTNGIERKVRSLILWGVILISVFIFLFKIVLPALKEPGIDYFSYYVAGVMWNQGQNPYDYALFDKIHTGMGGSFKELSFLYPPQIYIVSSFLGNFSLLTSYRIFILASAVLIVASIFLLGLVIQRYRPLGLTEVAFLSLFLITIYTRYTIGAGQITAPLFFCTIAAWLLTYNGKNVLAGVFLSFLSIKPTFLVFFFGYFLLKRNYRLLISCVIAAILLGSVPLVLSGQPLVETYMNWLSGIGGPGSSNRDASPFLVSNSYMMQMQILVNRVLNAQSTMTTIISWIIVLAFFGAILFLIARTRSDSDAQLLNFALVASFSLIAVYHRWHSNFLMFPGLIYVYLYIQRLEANRIKVYWSALLIGLLASQIVPSSIFISQITQYPELHDYYIVRVLLPYTAWANVALLCALVWLKRKQYLQQGSSKTVGTMKVQAEGT